MIISTPLKSVAKALCPIGLLIPQAAIGQDRNSARVAELPANENREPAGLDVAGMRLKLSLDSDLFLDDNIYAVPAGETGDVYLKLSSRLALSKETSRFKLTTGGSITRFQYADNPTENRWDWLGNAGLEVEPLHQTFVRAGVSLSHSHEDRGDPNSDFSSVSPTPYDLLQTELSLSRELGKLRANVEGSYYRYDYQDTHNRNGGLIHNQDRDRSLASIKAKATFRFSPGYSAVIRGEWSRIDYRLPLDDNGINRDSNGLRLTGGIYLSLTNVLDGEIFAGYQRRSYASPALRTFASPLYGAALVWSATRKTRVRLSADRRVEETTRTGSKNYVLTTYELAADHEFTPDLSLTVSGRRGRNDFLALAATGLSAPNRRDTLTSLDVAAKYRFGRNFTAGATYILSRRNSSTPLGDYARNRLNISLSARF